MSFVSVRAAYDRWSAFYDEYENPMAFMAAHVLARGLATHISGKSIFEFGCGTGRNLQALKQAGALRSAGCDLSPGMLAKARGLDTGAELLVHDMAKPLPELPNDYDAVLFSLTLEHIESLLVPLTDASRILAHNGSVHILEIHPFLSLNGVAAHFMDGDEEVRMPTYPHQFAAYCNACASAGLRIAECREWAPRDLDVQVPLKMMKRGPDFPMLVEFTLRKA